MNHDDFKYVDTAFGAPNRRNKPLSVDDVNAKLPADPTDCFTTWHRFTENYFSHVQNTGSVTGYDGPSYADFIVFDFDGADLKAVIEEVRQFLKTLEVTYEIDGLTASVSTSLATRAFMSCWRLNCSEDGSRHGTSITGSKLWHGQCPRTLSS